MTIQSLLVALLVFVVPLGATAEASSSATTGGYKVGTARAIITPNPGAWLAGYGRARAATGKHDDLFAKVMVISDAQTSLVIITIDCIGLTRPDILLIQQGVHELLPEVDPTHVIVSSTHTHAGPDVVGLWGSTLWSSGVDADYMERLRLQAISAVHAAFASRVAARGKMASAEVPPLWIAKWVQNRSEPGLLDTSMSVLQFVDSSGESLVTLTNFACHPTVLDGDNTLVSADYVAGFYQAMSATLPGEHLFLQGAIGGWVQPLLQPSAVDLKINLARRLGSEVAMQSKALLSVAEDNPAQSLLLKQQVFDIELDNWGFRLMMWLGVLDRETYSGAMRTSASWFRIGQAQFVTHPGETSPAYSLRSRELMNTKVSFVLGLAQDALGYILKPDYFAEDTKYPHGEYLQSVSVGPQAGPKLMQVLAELIGAR